VHPHLPSFLLTVEATELHRSRPKFHAHTSPPADSSRSRRRNLRSYLHGLSLGPSEPHRDGNPRSCSHCQHRTRRSSVTWILFQFFSCMISNRETDSSLVPTLLQGSRSMRCLMEMELIAVEAPSSANGWKHKPSPPSSGLGDLHDDMLERVLTHLPPASYFRLRAVCRRWLAATGGVGRRWWGTSRGWRELLA
jgi:hypothetical protein